MEPPGDLDEADEVRIPHLVGAALEEWEYMLGLRDDILMGDAHFAGLRFDARFPLRGGEAVQPAAVEEFAAGLCELLDGAGPTPDLVSVVISALSTLMLPTPDDGFFDAVLVRGATRAELRNIAFSELVCLSRHVHPSTAFWISGSDWSTTCTWQPLHAVSWQV